MKSQRVLRKKFDHNNPMLGPPAGSPPGTYTDFHPVSQPVKRSENVQGFRGVPLIHPTQALRVQTGMNDMFRAIGGQQFVVGNADCRIQ